MMDGLIVWAAIGPILAFIAGAVVVACLDDDETEDLPLPDYLRPANGTAHPADRPARSCLQCGRRPE
ncbi:hypothetical protein [Inquilinus sp. OTU3971]|uniref:hypothetical protein n=1 Tax=Inquilinus sp. OTU3971 TaxID=3043855 RepID=UPI00313C1678